MQQPWAAAGPKKPHARIRAQSTNPAIMDIERINAIGSLLADLSERTEQLRRYL
jgi:hypothetical protein